MKRVEAKETRERGHAFRNPNTSNTNNSNPKASVISNTKKPNNSNIKA